MSELPRMEVGYAVWFWNPNVRQWRLWCGLPTGDEGGDHTTALLMAEMADAVKYPAIYGTTGRSAGPAFGAVQVFDSAFWLGGGAGAVILAARRPGEYFASQYVFSKGQVPCWDALGLNAGPPLSKFGGVDATCKAGDRSCFGSDAGVPTRGPRPRSWRTRAGAGRGDWAWDPTDPWRAPTGRGRH